MEKVRPWCGQPSDRGRLKNRTEQNRLDDVTQPRPMRNPCTMGLGSPHKSDVSKPMSLEENGNGF